MMVESCSRVGIPTTSQILQKSVRPQLTDSWTVAYRIIPLFWAIACGLCWWAFSTRLWRKDQHWLPDLLWIIWATGSLRKWVRLWGLNIAFHSWVGAVPTDPALRESKEPAGSGSVSFDYINYNGPQATSNSRIYFSLGYEYQSCSFICCMFTALPERVGRGVMRRILLRFPPKIGGSSLQCWFARLLSMNWETAALVPAHVPAYLRWKTQ